MIEAIRRERETENTIRSMDIGEIVEWVHNLEDEIEKLSNEIQQLKEELTEFYGGQ